MSDAYDYDSEFLLKPPTTKTEDDGPKFETRVIELVVCHDGKEQYDDSATVIRIEDDGGGEFVTVKNAIQFRPDVVAINKVEWPALRAAIDRLIAECRE